MLRQSSRQVFILIHKILLEINQNIFISIFLNAVSTEVSSIYPNLDTFFTPISYPSSITEPQLIRTASYLKTKKNNSLDL